MTDLFFPMHPPAHAELRLITVIRYKALRPAGGKFTINAINTDLNIPASEPFDVPSDYYEHVRRFLWRHQVFMGVEKRKEELSLAVGLSTRAQCYIAYMDAMIEGLFTKARRSGGGDWRSDIFDLYLVVDHLVQGHEYNVGSLWRMENPDRILETVDVNTLDWKTFYATVDKNDPVWTGSSYQFDIANVAEGSWQDLADATANYLGLTNPKVKFHKEVVLCNLMLPSLNLGAAVAGVEILLARQCGVYRWTVRPSYKYKNQSSGKGDEGIRKGLPDSHEVEKWMPNDSRVLSW
ncbi:hypothetical protein F5141DRAFT_1063706 [Pisolithus sp. B1]|nr:hypothetical protein F5141DRAFT_1063706 [Pisolithus sp. B1]